jgi:hypothetical protein
VSFDAYGDQASAGTRSYAYDALGLTDSHGDVLGQFTAAGTGVLGSRAYDPWGAVTATTGTMTGMLGFQSSCGKLRRGPAAATSGPRARMKMPR